MVSQPSSMMLLFLSFLTLSLAQGIHSKPWPKAPWKVSKPGPQIIERDVVVIGGGASGTIAALKLKDANKTVAIIEQKSRLGGHTETYHDPITGGTVDCGVVVYETLPITYEIFGRYNISLSVSNLSALPYTFEYADFKTGTLLNYSSTNTAGIASALEKYYGILSANFSYLDNGFDLPDPVPEDLLMTFGEFVAKYELEAAVFSIASYAQGFGDVLNLPALYVLKYFNPQIVIDMSIGFLATTKQDNSLLYEAATAELGSSVFLDSQITSISRKNGSYVTIEISTPTGCQTIHASQVVFSIPPKVENIGWLDMDETESSLFSQFTNKGYFTALLRNTGLSSDTLITNLDPTTPYYLPSVPGIYNVQPTGFDDLLHVFYGSNSSLSPEAVQSDILNTIPKLRALQDTSGTSNVTGEPEFEFFSAHQPFLLTVDAESIREGFYTKLGALQGYRNTWYTGATFHTHQSTLLWQFTDTLVKRILAEAF